METIYFFEQILMIICLIYSKVNANLFCNGDLQNYTMTDIQPSYQSGYMSSNPYCWYKPDMGLIELHKRIQPLTTKYIQMANSAPDTLCQQIVLEIGQIYQLTYDGFTRSPIQSSVITSFLNNQELGSLQILGLKKFGSKSIDFSINSNPNQICFKQTHSPPQYTGVAAGLDNVTLNLVSNNSNVFQNQTVSIKIIYLNFQIKTQETDGYIQLVSNVSLNQQQIDQFSKRYIFNIKQNQIPHKINKKGQKLLIYMYPSDSILLKDISYQERKSELVDEYKFQITLSYKETQFSKLNEDEISAIKSLTDSASVLIGNATTAISFASLSAFSYFILNILSFSVSLFYIFLSFQSIPNFMYQIYYQMINIFFQNASLIYWIQVITGYNVEDLIPTMKQMHIDEIIKQEVQGKLWFGSFGVSGYLLDINNIESFMLIILLLVKFLAIKLFITFAPKIIKQNFDLSIKWLVYLLCQIISFAPIMLVSSSIVFGQSYLNPYQKFNKILLITINFILFISLYVYLVVDQQKKQIKSDYKQTNSKKESIKNDHKSANSKKDGNNNTDILKILTKVHTNYEPLNQSLILVSLPLALAISSGLFVLSIMTLVIGFKYFTFCKKKHKYKIDKILNGLLIIVWSVHHLGFATFYMFDRFEFYEDPHGVKNKLGIMLIGTVLCGFVIEMLKIVFSAIIQIFLLLKKIYKLCNKSSNNSIQPSPQMIEDESKSNKKNTKDRIAQMRAKQKVIIQQIKLNDEIGMQVDAIYFQIDRKQNQYNLYAVKVDYVKKK